MKNIVLITSLAIAPMAIPAIAQTTPAPIAAPKASQALPAETMIKVTPSEEITSKKMKEGTTRRFQIVEDVLQNGAVIIPRGSPVVGEIVWRTGKGIGGKSAKFEVAFRTVSINGVDYKLHGKHRQEGRGNTAAALLGSIFISGRSATMSPGQVVNAFTDQEISY